MMCPTRVSSSKESLKYTLHKLVVKTEFHLFKNTFIMPKAYLKYRLLVSKPKNRNFVLKY